MLMNLSLFGELGIVTRTVQDTHFSAQLLSKWYSRADMMQCHLPRTKSTSGEALLFRASAVKSGSEATASPMQASPSIEHRSM